MESNKDILKQLNQRAALKKLDVFIGKWHAEGQSYGNAQEKDNPHTSVVPWISEESYEWLAGNFFILHTWNAKVGDSTFIGTEVIGYDEEENGFFTRFFDNSGFHPNYSVTVDGNVWNFTGLKSRAKVIVSDDKNKMTFTWEWRENAHDWLPLCDRVATRVHMEK